MLQVYSTHTRRKEPFQPLVAGKVRMYVCGPTVYADAHIGHAMSAVVSDVIRRYLEHKGFAVRHVVNYTDVDDKIIQRAAQLGIPAEQLAERHVQAYRGLMEDLNVLRPGITPRATQCMTAIQDMVRDLLEQGHAYVSGGDVYFRVSRFPGYGKLSGRRLDGMQAGVRADAGAHKESPVDFALWKAAKPGEPFWESPWGRGRPGWHIECSAMARLHLGDQIDIHGGGNDLVFPHHENEIAQTESLTGKPFARYWMHNGMLQLGGQKMSKSTGNLVTIKDFLAHHSADSLRLMVLNATYRAPLAYTEEIASAADNAADRLRGALGPARPGAPGASPGDLAAVERQRQATHDGFTASMDDDFGTAGALACLFDLTRAINTARDHGATADQLSAAQATVRELAGILGLTLAPREGNHTAAAGLIDLLVELRDEARARKDWVLADRIRDGLVHHGVAVEDRADGGSSWRPR